MRNFIIFLLVFLAAFFLMLFLLPDKFFIFIVIYLALIISAICLLYYLGLARGLFVLFAIIALPFIIEYALSFLPYSFLKGNVINYLSWQKIDFAINLNNLFAGFNIPTIFICSLIFSQKIVVYSFIKSGHKLLQNIIASLLIAFTFLYIDPQKIEYASALKWLIIALIANYLILKLIKFKTGTPEIYKEMPIIIYLIIYLSNYTITNNYYYLIFTGLLLIYYLITLWNEHKIKMANQSFSA
ncbi:MAG: hypothetical protein NTZ49_04745 [Candidatus Parcubacteria bacterium]|nr:hypothetical protein [Candidatus Parcubacteria bacterium]